MKAERSHACHFQRLCLTHSTLRAAKEAEQPDVAFDGVAIFNVCKRILNKR
jgi:hypothetical protein